jgi:hypothetical protein
MTNASVNAFTLIITLVIILRDIMGGGGFILATGFTLLDSDAP